MRLEGPGQLLLAFVSGLALQQRQSHVFGCYMVKSAPILQHVLCDFLCTLSWCAVTMCEVCEVYWEGNRKYLRYLQTKFSYWSVRVLVLWPQQLLRQPLPTTRTVNCSASNVNMRVWANTWAPVGTSCFSDSIIFWTRATFRLLASVLTTSSSSLMSSIRSAAIWLVGVLMSIKK